MLMRKLNMVSTNVVMKMSLSLRAALASTVVVLPAFWSMGQLRTWWSPPLDAVVFAVMLAVALPRAFVSLGTRDLPAAGAALLAGAAAAVGCAMLLGGTSWQKAAGAALFAIGVAVPVWLRRFGSPWRASGTLAAVPFLAVLVHPLPDQARWAFLGWMLLAAGIAALWAAAIHVLIAPGPAPAGPAAPARPATRRVAASTRMAVQLALAVGAAFAFGQWIDPAHLVWPVLTVLVVHSGNRGRGDVLWKGAERTAGALVGTAVATWLTGLLPSGDSLAIVAVFAILALAAGLGEISYAGRAACTTAALAFLYGYFGQVGAGLLAHRLLGVLAGAVIGVAAAWIVLPVRTSDIARLRVGALLAAAAALAASATAGTTAGASDGDAFSQLAAADRELAVLAPTLRAARRFGIGAARQLDHTATNARALASEVTVIATSRLSTDSNTTPADAKLADLTQQITRARQAIRNNS
jgi:Fusaric acid resistance protein-like